MERQTLLLIDGFNLLSRGYFATSYGKNDDDLQKNSDGKYINGLRVFFQKLFNLISEHEATHVAVAWDVKRNETKRSQMHEFYKAQRNDLPEPLIEQYHTCTEVLDKVGITQLTVPSYEADDVIGAISSKWCNEMTGACYIYSNDKDLFQLLKPNVSQILSLKKQETVYTIDHFKEEYGINANQWIDVKALLGDRSDNIPGCPGVGEKSALPLIQQYGSIERVFEQIEELDQKYSRYKKKLNDGKESTFISKELAKIICEIEEIEQLLFDELHFHNDESIIRQGLNDIQLNIRL
ncbi:5'-3' exonuclease [Evansella halocellulosilytica]|uniref:5'-3' exonuclease n=1 Tax=Evansella halocellulosilytica TaxID=2011013 RepID=UPI000BB83DB3|nr:5'-3' exonuclease [Evansella halocellulosilytica]